MSQKEETVHQHQYYTMKPSVWRQLKRNNTLSKEYLSRKRKIDRFVCLSSPLQSLQSALFRRKIERISLEDKAPLFILGHWRSGTTHLHYTLAQDERFDYLCNYQTYIFNIALLSKSRVKRLTARFFPETRPQDNVKISPNDPAEEEQALCLSSVHSGIHSFFFPQNRTYFDKYNLFKSISAEEKLAWQKDYHFVLQSIMQYGAQKPLLLKNPHNTGRVKELLELYPDAKFIFLHRNPYQVYKSTIHLFNKLVESQYLQTISQQELHDLVLYNYRTTHQKYLEEKKLIPSKQLFEVSFDELENGLSCIENIYKALDLPDFSTVKSKIQNYLDSLKDYKKNTFVDLPPEIKQNINKAWGFFFEAYGYNKQ